MDNKVGSKLVEQLGKSLYGDDWAQGMDKSTTTRVMGFIGMRMLKWLCKRTDNKVDDGLVDSAGKQFYGDSWVE
ncbi:MAG: hypothetical protein ACRC92_26455 [Peptostreptococcaceae bacterium]